MKKKTIAIVLSGAMAFSALTAFTACDGGGTKKPEEPNASLVSQKIDQLTTAIDPEVISSLSATASFSMEQAANGATQKTAANLSLGANPKKGDLDLSVTGTATAGEASQALDGKIYMRDWNMFMNDGEGGNVYSYGGNLASIFEEGFTGTMEEGTGETATPDINEMYAPYASYVKDIMDILGMVGNGDTVEGVATSAAKYSVAVSLSVLQAGDAVSATEDSITIDSVKFLSTVTTDLKTVVASVNENTTYLDLMKNELVKKYMTAMTCNISASKLHEKVPTVLTSIKENIIDPALPPAGEGAGETTEPAAPGADWYVAALSLLAVQPDANSTAYEYVIKICESKAMDDLMGEAGNPLRGKILAGMPAGSWDEFKTSLNQTIQTENGAVTITVPGQEGTTAVKLEKATTTYKLGAEDGSIGMATELAASINETAIDQTASSMKLACKLDMTLARAELTLADVNGYTVQPDSIPVFPDGESAEYADYYNEIQDVSYTIIPVFANNEVASFIVKNIDEQVVASEYDAANGVLTFENCVLFVSMETSPEYLEITLTDANQSMAYLYVYAESSITPEPTTIGAILGK